MNNNLFTLTRICQAIKFLNNNKPIGLAIIIFSNAIMNIRIELKLELKEEANK